MRRRTGRAFARRRSDTTSCTARTDSPPFREENCAPRFEISARRFVPVDWVSSPRTPNRVTTRGFSPCTTPSEANDCWARRRRRRRLPARAEHICDALSAQGVSYNVEVKSHATVVDVSDGSLEGLEAYLHGVAMDDALSVDTMDVASPGAHLASCLTPDGRAYSFPQRVAHVTM